MVFIPGTASAETLNGTDDNDWIFGQAGNDTLYGRRGDDFLSGGNDNDTLYGEGGNDTLYGSNGNDSLNGLTGNDFLYGGDGQDNLEGSFGNDFLIGESGDDTLNGAGGFEPNNMFSSASRGMDEVDTLTGGVGADTFRLEFSGAGRDGRGISYRFRGNSDYALITDFNSTQDKITLSTTDYSGPSYILTPVTYSLGAPPTETGIGGVAIYADNLGAQPELIAILQGVSSGSLSLTADYFKYVPYS